MQVPVTHIKYYESRKSRNLAGSLGRTVGLSKNYLVSTLISVYISPRKISKIRELFDLDSPPLISGRQSLILKDFIPGSIYLDMFFHAVDILCWMSGENPQSVYAKGAMLTERFKRNNILENASTLLTFPSGLLANISCWRYSPSGYDSRIEVNTYLRPAHTSE